MRIVIAPAKKMRLADAGGLPLPMTRPVFLEDAERIVAWMRGLDLAGLKRLWAASDAIVDQNVERLAHMDLCGAQASPAVLAYDGIAFQYMAPAVFEDGHFAYVQDHLRILSGLYGVLRPLDGVVPYRLEMQAKAQVAGTKNLYDYWGDRICREVLAGEADATVVNLASQEYSRCVARHLGPGERMVSCVFGELVGGRVVQKGVYAKMARGDMVRFLAEVRAERPEAMRAYDRLGYAFDERRSSEDEYVFVKE